MNVFLQCSLRLVIYKLFSYSKPIESVVYCLNISSVHPKNSNYLRSHSRAIMVLDHSRLGLEKKFWKTNQAEFFQFDKFTLQNHANKPGGV